MEALMPGIQQTVLPRWRGFNLLDMLAIRSSCDFNQDDFRWISDWGFDFVRIPACYTLRQDQAALYAFCFHRQTMARRYRGISS